MAYNSQQILNNPLNVLNRSRATIDSNNSRQPIQTTLYSNTNYLSNNTSNINRNTDLPTNQSTIKMVSNNHRLKTECHCDKEFVEFCKIHCISHSSCLVSNQVNCQLCSLQTDYKSIQWHISSEKHKQKHKQLMDYVFLLSIPIYGRSQAFKITQLLESNYKKNSLNKSDINLRLGVVKDLNELMKNNGLKDYSVRLYGSTINGFGLKESDINLDIILDNPEKDKTDKALESVSIILSKMSEIIERNNKIYSNVRNEYNLKVPKVRFKERRTNFEIELSITVEKSWRSSKLLHQYCMIDDRVGLLGSAFRQWARMYNFDDQENGLWPGYAFPVLVIHFLQRCSPPVLPCLHEFFANNSSIEKNKSEAQNHSITRQTSIQNEDNDSFEDIFDLRSLNWIKNNHKSVGELWLEMLRYYTVEFDAETYVVSIRSTHNIQTRADKNWSTRMLAIEDPTRPSLNLSRSVGSMRLYNVFVEQLKNTFKYFAIPFINFMTNNTFNNVPTSRASPLFTERDFEVLVNQYQYYDSFNVNDMLTQINYVNNEKDNESESKANKGSDDSDSEDENRRKENFHLKTVRILKTFGIRMKLTPEIENTLPLIPTDQLNYSFQLYKLPFFQKPSKFCRLCHRYSHQQNNCPDNQLPAFRPLPDYMDNTYNELLCKICFQIFEDKRMDQNDERIQNYILNDLENFIRNLYPKAKLELFGSTKNGFGARNCDLDICLTFEDNQTGEELEFEKIIGSIGQLLKEHERLTNITPIVSAKVPIVKFGYIYDRNRCVECDISLYNILARFNTLWLRLYTKIDARVQVLGFVVKHFAKV